MRYFKIFLLYFQDVFSERARILVWLMLPIVNSGLFLAFWHAAFLSNSRVLVGWDSSSISIYYLLMIVAAALLLSHVEVHAMREIQQGEIVKYLLKPLPLYTVYLFDELPYRLIQGFYAISGYILVAFLVPSLRIPAADFWMIPLLVVMFILSFFLIHTYKLILAFISFWTKDVRGFTETSEVILILFAGFSVPLDILPNMLYQISIFLPFSYFVYFPVLSLMGKLTMDQIIFTFAVQVVWLIIFIILYKVMLKYGLKKFTAVGQ